MKLLFSRLKEISIDQKINMYLVGDFVRDFVLGIYNNDIDCVVQSGAENIANTFANRISSDVIILKDDTKTFKVFDKNSNATISFSDMEGNRIEEDLARRDFTINSLAIDVLNFNYNSIDRLNIIDPNRGLRDIDKEIVVHVYDDIFKDEPVRMLKAVRLMSQLEFNMHNKTKRRILIDKKLIKHIPGEKVTSELFKILENKNTYYYFNFMDKHLNILEEIFPEIIPMKHVGQCKYHVVDSLTHSLLTLKTVEDIIYHDGYFEKHVREAYEKHSDEFVTPEHKRLELIKLASFFHDVGKPQAKRVDEEGRTRFKGHEIIGAEIIRDIAERLRLSIKEKDILYYITAKHMVPLVLYKNNDVSGKTLYSLFSEFQDNTLDVLLIALSDIIATRKLLNPNEDMGKFKVHIEYLANNYITRFKDIEEMKNAI